MSDSPRFPRLVVNPRGASRLDRGHRWVFSNEVESVEDAASPGGEVAVFHPDGRFFGSAVYNAHALIRARLFSTRTESFDEKLLEKRLRTANERRKRMTPERQALRIVFAESDGIPGLIVDRYGPVIVFQLQTLALEQRRDLIIRLLTDVFHPEALVERSDSSSRRAEELEERKALVSGVIPDPLLVEINGFALRVDPLEGQKTGLYLDQIENWKLAEHYAKDRRVLDLFCHAGGFALHAARGGAQSVRCVDSSEPALSQVLFNAERNGVAGIRAKTADAFTYVRSMPQEFDLIICDPPPFARSRKQLDSALRGYRELNRWCLKMIPPGGVLITCSCSAAVGNEDFDRMLVQAARDAERAVRLLPAPGQPADHAPLLAMPETHYLKLRVLEIVG